MKFSHIFVFLIAVGCVDLTSSKEIKIAAFNIKIFGQKKVSDKAVVDVLVKIISRYDLILVQEIRDQAGTAIETLLQAVNSVSDAAYSHVISDRLGRSSSKEQYSFFYRHADFTPVATYQYPDPGDVFEREPFNVRFEADDWALPDLVLSAIHTKPDDAVVELSRMVAVYEDLLERWDLKDVIMLGDFNADCRYVTESEWSQVDLRTDKRFEWYIEDEEDTTVRESTDCAYDRFAIAGEDLQKAVVSSEVFDFETEYELTKEMAESVSDHFPVEMTLSDSGLEMTLSDSTLRIPNDNIKDGNRDEGDAVAVGFVALITSMEIKIGSFNIKIFGQRKVSDQEVVDVLVKIITRYDLILIQEIRDKAGTAIERLLQEVNDVSDAAYSHVISDRLGRSSSKEQYSFFYKCAIFTLVDSYVYPDPGDVIEREPFNVRFKVDGWALPDLVLSAIHTKPDDAVVELSRMVAVYDNILERWDLKDVIMLGDFNADCRYVTESEWPQVGLRTDARFKWYINDDEDTTVRESTDCAYDRFVVAGEDLQNAVVSSNVFDFEKEYELTKEMAERVSDHFPIEMTLSDHAWRIPNDGDAGIHCHALWSWFKSCISICNCCRR